MSSCCAPTCCTPAASRPHREAACGRHRCRACRPGRRRASARERAGACPPRGRSGCRHVCTRMGTRPHVLALASIIIDRAASALLAPTGWQAPGEEAFPTGNDLVDAYLRPLAELPQIASRLKLNARVTAVARARLWQAADRRQGYRAVRCPLHRTGRPGEEPARQRGDRHLRHLGDARLGGCQRDPGRRRAPERATGCSTGCPMSTATDRTRLCRAGRQWWSARGDSAKGTLIELGAAGRTTLPGTTIIWAARNADLTRAFGGGASGRLGREGSALGTRVPGHSIDSGRDDLGRSNLSPIDRHRCPSR